MHCSNSSSSPLWCARSTKWNQNCNAASRRKWQSLTELATNIFDRISRSSSSRTLLVFPHLCGMLSSCALRLLQLTQMQIHKYKYINTNTHIQIHKCSPCAFYNLHKKYSQAEHCTFYKASEAVRQCQLKLTKYVTTCDCWWSFQEKWAGWIGWNCVHFNWSVSISSVLFFFELQVCQLLKCVPGKVLWRNTWRSLKYNHHPTEQFEQARAELIKSWLLEKPGNWSVFQFLENWWSRGWWMVAVLHFSRFQFLFDFYQF